MQDPQQALASCRQQCDEIGDQLRRVQQELTQTRRVAHRNRITTLVAQKLYDQSGQTAIVQPLGDTLVALLAESFEVECAALLRWRETVAGFVLEYGLGLTPSFTLPLPATPPTFAFVGHSETLPAMARTVVETSGLQVWLWVAVPEAGWGLLLGSRQRHPADAAALDEADHFTVAAALKMYVSLLEQQQAMRLLRTAEANYRTLFENAYDALAVLDISSGALRDANQQTLALLGCPLAELRRRPPTEWLNEPEPTFWRPYWLRALAGRSQRFECPLRAATGRVFWAEIQLRRIATVETGLLLAAVRDISERKLAEAQLRYYGFHDALTGLPNRTLALERLEQALKRRQRHPDYLFALLFLDLDRFKIINDSLGHSVGDQLLIIIGQRLGACLRQEDTVARLGGDEFLILLNELRLPEDAIFCAERLDNALAAPFTVDGHEIYTRASIGIVLAGERYENAEAMLRDADIAMYQAKARGNAYRFTLFDPVMHTRMVQLMEIERDLRRAVEREEFLIHYQPIVVLGSGQIKGFEALVRWRHPERGLVSPDDFIPTAEESLLILPIGRQVLTLVCRQLQQWAQRFPQPPSVNVNLSSRQITAANLVGDIGKIVSEYGCDPTWLDLEITESVILENTEAAQATLRQLHAQGFRFSLDDFGTGYSSLSYLQQFPFDTLKIDRSFIRQLNSDDDKAKIVNTIIALGRALGKTVVAEGVETREQAAYLVALGCELGQGYYFSRPVEADNAEALLRHTLPYAQSTHLDPLSTDHRPRGDADAESI